MKVKTKRKSVCVAFPVKVKYDYVNRDPQTIVVKTGNVRLKMKNQIDMRNGEVGGSFVTSLHHPIVPFLGLHTNIWKLIDSRLIPLEPSTGALGYGLSSSTRSKQILYEEKRCRSTSTVPFIQFSCLDLMNKEQYLLMYSRKAPSWVIWKKLKRPKGERIKILRLWETTLVMNLGSRMGRVDASSSINVANKYSHENVGAKLKNYVDGTCVYI